MNHLYTILALQDRKKVAALSAKEKRDLVFLFCLMAEQRPWLVDNLKWILKNNEGDLIASWLSRYMLDPLGYCEPLDDCVWLGCLADYYHRRNDILDEWRSKEHENRKACVKNRFRQGKLDL